MKRFEGKHILVTGGASGIGRAAVERFAQEGARISIIDKDISDEKDIKNSIRQGKKIVNFLQADVTEPQQLFEAIKNAIILFGELNVVFANAGIGGGDLVSKIAEEQWEKVIRTNLNGIFFTCKYSIPSLIKTPGNSIVTMASSMAGWDTSLKGAAYMASKEAVIGFTKSLALQLAQYGVRVNAICPGVINTPLSGDPPEKRQDRYEQFSRRIPLRRVGLPDDVAAAVAFLASADAKHITGSKLLIDGGQTLQSWSNAPDLNSYPLEYDPGDLLLNE